VPGRGWADRAKLIRSAPTFTTSGGAGGTKGGFQPSVLSRTVLRANTGRGHALRGENQIAGKAQTHKEDPTSYARNWKGKVTYEGGTIAPVGGVNLVSDREC